MNDKLVLWSCPLCSLKMMPYGATCEDFKTGECANIQFAHITGQVYVKRLGLEPVVRSERATGGLNLISDEGM